MKGRTDCTSAMNNSTIHNVAIISRVEALNFRCLHSIYQDLTSFHVLVGPNASGKTTFLDVISFLGDMVSGGLDTAIARRTENPHDLLWRREGAVFELAIEATIPKERQEKITLKGQDFDTVRYEVTIGIGKNDEVGVWEEKGWIFSSSAQPNPSTQQRIAFPQTFQPVETLKKRPKHARTILNKTKGGTDKYYSEVAQKPGQSNWSPTMKLGPRRSALGSLPYEEERFPAMTWFQQLLVEGVQSIQLNSLKMRDASPPGKGTKFLPDGSNLPWVVDALLEKEPGRFNDWIAHLQTALPDFCGLKVITRQEDRHKYLMLRYLNGVEVPSWTASDGTLRLLALTLLAYLSELSGVYLIEEPENGIHPRAVETMFDSLRSVYDAQILLATHSPVILNLAQAEDILCFSKDQEGATDIVRGNHHPSLLKWQGESSLGTLFAADVLS